MTSPWLVPILLAATLFALEPPARAVAAEDRLRQEWSELGIHLRSGDQPIAELSSGQQVTGAFVAVDGNGLVVWVQGAAKRFLRENIRTALRVRASRRRGMVLAGAIAGAAVGLLFVADQEDFGAGGRLLFASIGAGAGAGVGAAFSKRTTRDVLYTARSAEVPARRALATRRSALPTCRSTVRQSAGTEFTKDVLDASRRRPLVSNESIASLLATSCNSDSLRGRGGTSHVEAQRGSSR